MRVSELMHTPAVTCGPTSTLREVGRLMEERHVGSVLVVDEVGELAGIVTDRDIVLRAVACGRSADIPVSEVMTRDVASIDVHADISEAAAVMVKHRVRRLPVVDSMGRAHGLVAVDDLLRNLGAQTDELTDLVIMQSPALAKEN